MLPIISTAAPELWRPGWVENTDKGTKYYFDPTTGAMYTGTQTIDGVTYAFSEHWCMPGREAG